MNNCHFIIVHDGQQSKMDELRFEHQNGLILSKQYEVDPEEIDEIWLCKDDEVIERFD